MTKLLNALNWYLCNPQVIVLVAPCKHSHREQFNLLLPSRGLTGLRALSHRMTAIWFSWGLVWKFPWVSMQPIPDDVFGFLVLCEHSHWNIIAGSFKSPLIHWMSGPGRFGKRSSWFTIIRWSIGQIGCQSHHFTDVILQHHKIAIWTTFTTSFFFYVATIECEE